MEQLNLVELADKLGFDEAWFAEHHFNGFSVIPDPCTMIGYAAGRTGCIRLGAAGFLAPFYHPVRLAESIAVLDNLSGGRINAGFAKGGFAPDTRHFMRTKEDLRSVMFETVETVDSLLHDDATEYDGEFIRVEHTAIAPRPVQKQVPFYVATFSSEETIAFAARRGFGLLMSQGATLRECVEAHRLYRRIAGHDPEMVLMRVFYVAESTKKARRGALPGIDHFVKCMRSAQSEQPQPHFDPENYDLLLRERLAFFDGQKFFDNGIIGSTDECLRTIQSIQKELPDIHLVLKPSSSDPAQNRNMLIAFNTQIRPHL